MASTLVAPKMPTGAFIILLFLVTTSCNHSFMVASCSEGKWGPCMKPLSLAHRNLQASEAAECRVTGETLPGAKQGEGITGRKERSWESRVVWRLCWATAVANFILTQTSSFWIHVISDKQVPQVGWVRTVSLEPGTLPPITENADFALCGPGLLPGSFLNLGVQNPGHGEKKGERGKSLSVYPTG